MREHPLISGFKGTGVYEDEGQHLQDVYPTAMDFGGPGRFGFLAGSHMTEASPLVSDVDRNRLITSWAPYWDMEKPFLLEKSPPNLVRTRFLQELFPDSYFIILTRHPVAVSLATAKWTKTSLLHTLIEHWLVCHETFRSDAPYLERFVVLKYEQFVIAPQKYLDKLYAFFGIESHLTGVKVYPNINQRYFSRWEKLMRIPIVRTYLQSIVSRNEKRVSQFGYSLDHLSFIGQESKWPPERTMEWGLR